MKVATGEDAEARKTAVSILVGMRSNAPWPGLALRDALDDPNPKVRERANTNTQFGARRYLSSKFQGLLSDSANH